MRQAELKTVCDSHKAHILCSGTAKGMDLKTDGTTKHQRKLGAVVVDDLVVSVNELANGKAISAIENISKELIHLRRVTKILGLANADSINWTLIESSMSDSASTQKRMNKLRRKRKM